MTEPSTAVTTTQTKKPNPVAILLTSVQDREKEFARALPAHVPAAKFVRALQTAITSSKDIGQCTERSVITECMKAAADGLVIDNREATLVKMNVNVGTREAKKWEAQAKYIPMTQGLMKMARNSGEISTISAVLVHENDQFRYNPGEDERPIHPVDWFSDRGAPIGAYCVVTLKDGGMIVEVMSKAQILKIGAGTKNSHQYDPEKGDSWGEWWRKTVIRRISKYMPRSTDREAGDFFEAVQRDDDLYVPGDDAPETPKPPRKKRGAGAAAMAAQPAAAPDKAGDDIPDFLRRTPETPVQEGEFDEDQQGGDPRDHGDEDVI